MENDTFKFKSDNLKLVILLERQGLREPTYVLLSYMRAENRI